MGLRLVYSKLNAKTKEMVYVFSKINTPRLIYTLQLAGELLGTELVLVHSPELILAFGQPFINYSETRLGQAENAISIIPSGFLSETEVRPNFEPETGNWLGLVTIFPNNNPLVPFDLFSAIFYLVSRYEEYSNFQADAHGRYACEFSFAYKHHVLLKPIVEYWLLAFSELLKGKFPEMSFFNQSSFEICPTIDVDNAWAFKNKGLWQNIGSGLGALLKGNLQNVSLRCKTMQGEPDPYHTYEQIMNLHKVLNLKANWFFLFSEKGKYDKGVSPQNKALHSLIRQIAETENVGIHPSYASFEKPEKLVKEVGQLAGILGNPVLNSRNHYIRFKLPDTYIALLAAGIRHDWSMGYATSPGFRAGLSRAFWWFNLAENRVTYLRVHPFCFMESTQRFHKSQSPAEALEVARTLVDELEPVFGCFTPVFHNESVGGKLAWEGWGGLYEEVLKVGHF